MKKKKLLKKIYKHEKSETHNLCVRIQNDAAKEEIECAAGKAQTVWEAANAEKLDATSKIFRTAYMCCKEDLAFTKHSTIVQLQELNNSTTFSMLYSDHSCANILKHIAQQMKTELNAYIMATDYPLSVMVDETTTLSTKSALIVYIRIQVQDEVCNFFYDLVDLANGSTGEEIAKAVLGCFSNLAEDPEKSASILRARLIGFSSDGASVMIGEFKGAVVKLQELLKTNILAVHCLAHRLELAVHNAVRASGEIERLQLFTDSLYTFYHRSYKNMYELSAVAESLHSELLRVSQVFTVRWVCSSYRAVKAFVNDYAVLVHHMKKCAEDRVRDSKDRAKCSGFAKKLQEWFFVAELLLLADVLEVLWHLSAYFQSRDASLMTAHPKVRVAISTLKAMKEKPGLNLSVLITAEKHCTVYQGIDLTGAQKDFEVCYLQQLLVQTCKYTASLGVSLITREMI